MIVLSSSEQLQRWDQATIAAQGITSLELMERAALAFTDLFVRKYPPDLYPRVCIVVGPGNNGGDGACIAWLLEQRHYHTTVFTYWADKDARSADLAVNWRRLERAYHPRLRINEDFAEAPEADVYIDALFGAGLSRPLQNPFLEVVRRLNALSAPVVSVDVPSGQRIDHLPEDWVCVRATETFTFGTYKLAALLPESHDYWGRVEVLDIDLIPFPAADERMLSLMNPQDKEHAEILGPRKLFTHKGSYGHVLIIAGSRGHAGAALLAARAAYRTGAGLVTVYGPSSIEQTLQSGIPEAMFMADSGKDHLESIPDLDPYDVVVCGPGIGQAPSTRAALEALLQNIGSRPLILDADALNLLANHDNLFALIGLDARLVLTPHPKEFSRLSGEAPSDSKVLRLMDRFLAKLEEKDAVLLLKNQYSIAAHSDGRKSINVHFGNPGMASGGTGDTLCGVIAACCAQGSDIFDATCLAVMVHGYAGDLASKDYGEAGLLASDLGDRLGLALQAFSTGSWKESSQNQP